MKYLFMLPIIISSLVSCDGRKSSKTVLQQSISKLRQKHQSENHIFFPQDHIKNITDTIYTNGLHIRIKNYTLTDKNIIVKSTINNVKNIKTINYRRILESEITLYKNPKSIYKTHINADKFKYKSDINFWKNATLENAWIDNNVHDYQHSNIYVSFINPIDDTYKFYRMHINEDGTENTYLIKDNI